MCDAVICVNNTLGSVLGTKLNVFTSYFSHPLNSPKVFSPQVLLNVNIGLVLMVNLNDPPSEIVVPVAWKICPTAEKHYLEAIWKELYIELE